MDSFESFLSTLSMTQSHSSASISRVIERYSTSSDALSRQYQSYIVPLDQHAPSSPQKKIVYINPSTADLGTLNMLPVEMIQEICIRLDLRSITRLRLVNRQFAAIVDSAPQYQLITRQSLEVLRGILSVEIGNWITVQALHRKLRNGDCESCGGAGSHLYLIRCKRLCYLCFLFK